MIAQKSKIRYLDGLKGLACLPVLLGHFKSDFLVLPGLEKLLRIPYINGIMVNGNWALNLFFIVSALLIAENILADPELNYQKLAGKMVKRYFRLSLPLLVLYEIIWVIQKLGLFANQEVAAILGTENYLGKYFTVEYTQLGAIREALIGTLFNGEFTFNSVMWMMQIMFVGWYLSVLLALLIRWGGTNCVGAVGFVFVGLLILNSQYVLFIAGVLLAYFLSKKVTINKKAQIVGIVALGTGYLLANYCGKIAGMMQNYTDSTVWTSWYLYSKMGAILFMIGIVINTVIQKILSFRLFQALNKISFPIFMFHRVVEGSVGSLIFLRIYKTSNSVGDATRMAWLGTVVVLVIVSVIYAYFIEPVLNKATNKIVGFVMESPRQKKEKAA